MKTTVINNMEKNYIPGPWMVIEDERADEVRVVQEDGYSDFRYTEICQIRQGMSEAYLIAATPDLLDALERMCDACNKYNLTEIVPEYEVAMDAIAKAYGKDVER